MQGKCEKFILLTFFLVAFLLRIVAVLNFTGKDTLTVSDEEYYNTIATNLSTYGEFSYDKGISTSGTVPIYPFFLSAVYSISNHNYQLVRLIQAILGSLVCIVIYFISKRLTDKKVALTSGIIASIYPALVNYPKYLLTETLFTFLFALAVLYLLKTKQDVSVKSAVITGILIGVTSLTRPITVLFPLLVTIWMMTPYSGNLRKRLKNLSIVLAFFLLTLTPWIVRNFIVHNEFVFTTNLGYTFYGANNPLAKGSFTDIRKTEPSLQELTQQLSETETNKIYLEKGLEFIRSQFLLKLFKLSARKLLHLFSPFCPRGYIISFGIIIPLSIIGIFQSLKYRKILLLYFVIFHFALGTVIFYGSLRFRVPLLPYLIIFASMGIVHLYTRFSNKIFPALIYLGILTINLFIYINADSIRIYLKNILDFLI